MAFEGLYQEPSLGHLVALVRYCVHRMEVVSKEEVSQGFSNSVLGRTIFFLFVQSISPRDQHAGNGALRKNNSTSHTTDVPWCRKGVGKTSIGALTVAVKQVWLRQH